MWLFSSIPLYLFGFKVAWIQSHHSAIPWQGMNQAEAPAKTLAEKTRAFAEQHGTAFAKSSMGSFGLNVKNASRKNSLAQFALGVGGYKRVLRRVSFY